MPGSDRRRRRDGDTSRTSKAARYTFMNKKSLLIALLAAVTACTAVITFNRARLILLPSKTLQSQSRVPVDGQLLKSIMAACFQADPNAERADTGLLLYYNGTNDSIKLSNSFLLGKGITLISVDNEIVSSSNLMTEFVAETNGNTLSLVPKYQLKPSRHIMKLMRSDRSVYAAIPIEFVYRYDAKLSTMNTSLWAVKYQDKFDNTPTGITIHPKRQHPRGLNAVTFGRRFENDLDLEFDFTPLGDPLIFTVNLSQGTQVAIGDINPMSVRLIKTTMAGKDRVEPPVSDKKFPARFIPGSIYTVRIKRTGLHYLVAIGEKGSGALQEVISYTDDTPEKNLKEKYKSIFFSVWKGSKGITITRVIIRG